MILQIDALLPTLEAMAIAERLRTINSNPAIRMAQLVVGILLVIATPLVGILPGPGGVIVFAFGLGLVLRNSTWAKRRYVRFKRHQPKAGRWADWGLQRGSAKRRVDIAKREILPDTNIEHDRH